jgi:hypothetical protein
MPLRIVEHRVVYKDPRYYCGPGPTVVATEEGELLVAFRRVTSWLESGHSGHWHPATESCLTRSKDGGGTWSSPEVFLGGYQCPNLTRLRDGTLVHSTHRMELVTEEIAATCPKRGGVRDRPWPGVHAGTAVWRSGDRGRTWNGPAHLAGVPGLTPLHPLLPLPVAVRGNVLEVEKGGLLISAYDLEAPNSAYLFQSADGGRSWKYQARIARGFNETFLHETERGDLVAFMRRWGDDPSVLHRACSRDGGRGWSTPAPVCRGYPACAVRLRSGRVLLAYGYRFEEGPGVRARLLSPECELIEPVEECIIRADGAVFDLGYPDAALLPDGRAAVVYYTNSRHDTPDAAAPRFIEICTLEEV